MGVEGYESGRLASEYRILGIELHTSPVPHLDMLGSIRNTGCISGRRREGTGGTRQSGCGLCVQRKNTQIFGFVLSYKFEDSHLLVRASG